MCLLAGVKVISCNYSHLISLDSQSVCPLFTTETSRMVDGSVRISQAHTSGAFVNLNALPACV